jgi:hypothetical protein
MIKQDLNRNEFLNVLETTKKELILNFQNNDSFSTHIDPLIKKNVLKKAVLLGVLTLFEEFEVKDLIDNIDDVILCQSILELASNIDLDRN